MHGKSVIIIGAGVGGIATAIILAKNGYKVDVYEKNLSPGGRCGQIIRDGHRFDLGATILLMPSIYKNIFKSLGLNFEECFELKTLSPIYKIYFGKEEVLSFSSDHTLMNEQLEKIEPGSFTKFKLYIEKGYFFFQISLKKLLGRNFFHLFEFITPGSLLLLINLKIFISHQRFVSRFFKHPYLKRAFTFQNIYVGQSPNKSPALFAMLPAVEIKQGALFPIGGMYRIVEKLITTAKELGVQFHYSSRVDKILTAKKAVKGIILQNGSQKDADIIVANADLPYVYSRLLPDMRAASKINKMKYACSAIVFHWGLDKRYAQLEHHSVFLSEGYNKNLEMIFEKKSMSDDPSFYIHAPVKTDPSSAPPGEDSLSIIVPVGHIDNKSPQHWEHVIKKARLSIINRLISIGLEDLEDHIKFEICYPPNSWESIYNVSKGSVFGSLSHSIIQMGYFRPHNRHKKYKNLFFTGGSTHPGNGVPLVLLSAKLTSEHILRDSKK